MLGGGTISWHRTGWGFPCRVHSVSTESLGTGLQRQEREAGLDKALGKVWLEDRGELTPREGQRLSQRDTAGQESRSGYHSTAT